MTTFTNETAKWLVVAMGAGLAVLPSACSEDTTEDNNDYLAPPEGGAGGNGTGGTVATGGSGAADAGGAAPGGAGGAGTDDPCGDLASRPVVEVTEDIVADETWECTNVYLLTKTIFVSGSSDAQTVLTVQPGTVIRGKKVKTTDPEPAALVITSTGRIEAEGTVDQPIVFTSEVTSNREPGDWGGLVLAGKAAVNTDTGTDTIEALAGGNNEYGGGDSPDDNHDCGTLKHVRIEFAGFTLSEGKELNGLGVAACGSQTEIDHVQVHKALDDGIELWGGTADLKHVIITGARDDSLDWDQGWRGRVQFLVVQQHSDGANEGVEADGYASVSSPNEPVSSPTLYNLTLLGTEKTGNRGLHLKEGTQATVRNAVVVDFPEGLVDIDNAETADWLATGDLTIQHSTFVGSWPTTGQEGTASGAGGAGGATSGPRLYIESDWFVDGEGSAGNEVVQDAASILPDGAFEETSPSWVPASDSPLGSSAASAHEEFFEDAPYRGAFEPGGSDWTAGWTAYPAD